LSAAEYNGFCAYIKPFPADSSMWTTEFLVPLYNQAQREMVRLECAAKLCQGQNIRVGPSTCDIGQRYLKAQELCLKVERWFEVFATPEQRRYSPSQTESS
jgi:hypothetical protein